MELLADSPGEPCLTPASPEPSQCCLLLFFIRRRGTLASWTVLIASLGLPRQTVADERVKGESATVEATACRLSTHPAFPRCHVGQAQLSWTSSIISATS